MRKRIAGQRIADLTKPSMVPSTTIVAWVAAHFNLDAVGIAVGIACEANVGRPERQAASSRCSKPVDLKLWIVPFSTRIVPRQEAQR